MRNIAVIEKSNYITIKMLLILFLSTKSIANGTKKIDFCHYEQNTRQLQYHASGILSALHLRENNLENGEISLNFVKKLTHAEYLRLLESLYIYSITNSTATNNYHYLITKIINDNTERNIPFNDFTTFLEKLLFISDDSPNSEQMLIQILNKTQIDRNLPIKKNLESLYIAAFLNDNPLIIATMIDRNIICSQDNINASEMLFLTHSLIYKNSFLTLQENANANNHLKLYGDRSMFHPCPSKYYIRERENGIAIINILLKAGYSIVNNDKYIYFLKKPTQNSKL